MALCDWSGCRLLYSAARYLLTPTPDFAERTGLCCMRRTVPYLTSVRGHMAAACGFKVGVLSAHVTAC